MKRARRWAVMFLIECIVLVAAASKVSAQRVALGSPISTIALTDSAVGRDQLNTTATNGRDRVLVSLEASRDLLVLDADGRLVSRSSVLADHMASPGEMAFLSPSTFGVMDRGGPHAIWGRLKGGNVQFARERRVEIGSASGTCSLQGNFVVAGVGSGAAGEAHLLHEVDSRKGVVRSFGNFAGGQDWAAKIMNHPSTLICTAGSDDAAVIVATQSMGEVRAMTRAGKVIWSFVPPGFVGVGYTMPSPGSMRFVWPPDSSWNEIEAVFSPTPDIIAIQVAGLLGRQPQRARSLTTYYVLRRSGHVVGTQEDLPVVHAILPGRLFVTGNDLHPSDMSVVPFTWKAR